MTVELEAWNPGNGVVGAAPRQQRQIDEAFIFAFGDWGRIEFGSRDAASYRMYYGAPSALIGWGSIQHNHNWATCSLMANNKAYGRTMTTTNTPTWQDMNRINYFTPRFAGLQIGVGYAPKINAPARQLARVSPVPARHRAADAAASPAPRTSMTARRNDYAWQDVFDVGANYLNKFGDVTVAAVRCVRLRDVRAWLLAAGAAAANGHRLEPRLVEAVGGSGAVRLQGLHGRWLRSATTTTASGANYYTGVDNATRFSAAGIMYETGPWQMSFQWQGATTRTVTAQHRRVDRVGHQHRRSTPRALACRARNSTCFSGNPATALAFGCRHHATSSKLGANYALGPGVKLTGGGMLYNAGGPTNDTSGTAWAILLGMDLRF